MRWFWRALIGLLLAAVLAEGGATNPLVRTTTALTIANAGNQADVLPGEAEATVNFRLLPGDTAESVIAHVKAATADERITAAPIGTPLEATALSSTSVDAFKLIERTVRQVFPDAVVAPGLVLQGTDPRHFAGVAEQS